MKSKLIAYLLWVFGGVFGFHKFYLGRIGMGLLYLCTGGILGIGWLIDFFTLSHQVDIYNALYGGGRPYQGQNIVINMGNQGSLSAEQRNLSPEKQILALSERTSVLTLRQIVAQTSLEIEEAETTLRKLVDRGMAKELIEPDGKLKYDFN
jgi:TM2 domain-containing membrane protein YozV